MTKDSKYVRLALITNKKVDKTMTLPGLKKEKKSSLATIVYDALKEAILSLQIKPKDYLYINEIAAYYKISNTPIREAFIRLEEDGWLKLEGRRGAQVVVLSSKKYLETVKIAASLMGAIARKAAISLDDENRNKLETHIRTTLDFLKNNSIPENLSPEELRFQFNELIFSCIDNDEMIMIVKKLFEKEYRVRKILWDVVDGPLHDSLEQHCGIIKAILDHNADQAYQLMFEHETLFDLQTAIKLENRY